IRSHAMQKHNTLATALLRAIRAVDYAAGGDDFRDEPAAVVNDGLRALLKAGVTIEDLCDDTQFEVGDLQRLAAQVAKDAATPQATDAEGVYSIDVKVVATAYIRA